MEIIFYSTHCPKCNVLKKKMDAKKIEYTEVDDVQVMQEKGFTSAPVLEIDGKEYQFSEAIKYINSL